MRQGVRARARAVRRAAAQTPGRLHFKDPFRHAARHDLITPGAFERWLHYRDNRNHTAHDYSESFSDTTLRLLPHFITDAIALAEMIERTSDD